MAFLEIDDMGTVIYDYQIEQIADGNDEALPEAINAAIDEVMGYLTPNQKKNWQDGRYTHVAVVATDDLDQAYELTNNIDKRWTDNIGVAPVDGHGKRSTDVGDVLELNGKFFVCASIGWDEIVF
jgi:hypothetical protein